MTMRRGLAVLLLLLGFAALAASRAFPFLDDIPEPVKAAVVAVGVACGLTGVWLWLRKAPGAEE